MSFKKSFNLGLVGIYILIASGVVKIIEKLNLNMCLKPLPSVLYFVGYSLLFLSFTYLFKYTENNKLSYNLNLIALFSTIPMIFFHVLNIVTFIIPRISELYTTSLIYGISNIINSSLIIVFIVGIYYKNSFNILNAKQIAFLILCIITLIINIINKSTILVDSSILLNSNCKIITPSLSILSNIFFLLIYEGVLLELKLLSLEDEKIPL